MSDTNPKATPPLNAPPRKVDEAPELQNTAPGTPEFPAHLDGESSWESTQGASWDETGSAPERIAPKQAREADGRRALNLSGGGAINDEDALEEPEAPELVQSGPARREP